VETVGGRLVAGEKGVGLGEAVVLERSGGGS
jgi:hypothetical protein